MDVDTRLSELRALREAHRNKIRCAHTNMDPSFYQRSKDHILVQLKNLNAQLQELEDGFDNGLAIVEASTARVKALNTEISKLENLQKIEKYQALTREVLALQGEVTKCEICGGIALQVIFKDSKPMALCDTCVTSQQ